MSYDIKAFKQDTPYYDQSLASSTDNGQTVSGMAKLVQRFLLELMTETNDVPLSTEGCDFVPKLMSGVSSELDVFTAFHSSVATVTALLNNTVTTSDPLTEQLSSVTVKQLLLSADSLILSLVLTNKAGQSSGVSVPLNFILS